MKPHSIQDHQQPGYYDPLNPAEIKRKRVQAIHGVIGFLVIIRLAVAVMDVISK